MRVLLSLTSFVPRIKPMKIVGTGQAFNSFSDKLQKHVFPTAFSSHPSVALSIYATVYKYWAGHYLSTSENCV